MLLLLPTATSCETRHVNTTEHASLIQNPLINISTTILPQLAKPYGTGLSRLAHNVAKRRDAGHSWISADKRCRKARLPRVFRKIKPKACTNEKTCKPNVPSVVRKVDKLAEDDPVVHSNLPPTVDSSSPGLAAEPGGAITYRDLPLETRHALFGSEPQSLSRRPDASHDTTTFGQSHALSYPPTNLRPEEWITPLGSLVAGPAWVTGAHPFPGAGFDIFPDTETRDVDQPSEPRSRLRMVKVPLCLAMDAKNDYNTQLDYLIGLLFFVTVASAKLREGATSISSGNATWAVRRRPGNLGTRVVVVVMFDREIPRLVVLRNRYATLNDPSPRLMINNLYMTHQGRSLRAELTTNHTHTPIPAVPPFHCSFLCRYTPCISTRGFVGTASTTVGRSTIARLLERFVPAPTALPRAWSVARCLSMSWRLGDLPGALILGVFYFSALAWNPNTSAGFSRFSHAPDSGQAPGGTYPGIRDEGGMGSDSKSILEPPYLGLHGEVKLYETEGLFSEGTVDLPSTLSYDHTGAPVPQQRDFTPATPIPLNAYGPHEWSHVGEHDHEGSSASVPTQTWAMTPPSGYTNTWRGLYRAAPAPSSPPSQQVNAFQSEQLSNLSHDVTDSFAQSVDVSSQSTNLHHANDCFQIPNISRIVQPELRVPGFGPDSNSTPTGSAHITEWIQPDWQHPYDDNYSTLGDVFSACVTDVAFAVPTSSVHPAPVPGVSPKSKPGSKISRGVHTCSLCGRSFRRPYLLNDHMNSRHKQGQPHRCEYPGCALAFTSRSNLRRHWSEKHQDTDDSHTKLHYTQSADAVESWVESGGLGDADPQSSVICQSSTGVEESALSGETGPAQQQVPGPSAPSTTGLPYLDFLFTRSDSSEDRVWARRG